MANDITTPANASAEYKQEIRNIVPSGSNSKPTIVLLGDSFVAAEEHQDVDTSSDRGIFLNLNSLLGSAFEVLNIAGVGGETLAQIRARFDTDVLPFNPGFVWILGGTNDVVAGRSAVDMFNDMTAMADKALDNGIIPVIIPCPLGEGTFGVVSAADQLLKLQIATTYNRSLETYSKITPRVSYLNTAWLNTIDQTNTSAAGAFVPAHKTQYALDLTHLNAAGAFRAALDIAESIRSITPIATVLPKHYGDTASGAWNPHYVSGTPSSAGTLGNDSTGTAPEGWHCRLQSAGNGSAVFSQVARTDIVSGFWNQAVVTGMGGGNNLDVLESDPAGFLYIYHLLSDNDIVAGDAIQFYFEFKLEAVSGSVVSGGELNGVNCTIQIVDAGNNTLNTLVMNKSTGSNAQIWDGADHNGEVRTIATLPYTVPANAAKWGQVRIRVPAISGAQGTTDFTFSQGRPGVRILS